MQLDEASIATIKLSLLVTFRCPQEIAMAACVTCRLLASKPSTEAASIAAPLGSFSASPASAATRAPAKAFCKAATSFCVALSSSCSPVAQAKQSQRWHAHQ